MNDLIEGMKILLSYLEDGEEAFHVMHGKMIFAGVPENNMSQEDRTRLHELGFRWNKEHYSWFLDIDDRHWG